MCTCVYQIHLYKREEEKVKEEEKMKEKETDQQAKRKN